MGGLGRQRDFMGQPGPLDDRHRPLKGICRVKPLRQFAYFLLSMVHFHSHHYLLNTAIPLGKDQ